MKRSLLVFLALALVSCSVQNRRYMSGYHVTWKGKSSASSLLCSFPPGLPATGERASPPAEMQVTAALPIEASVGNVVSVIHHRTSPGILKKAGVEKERPVSPGISKPVVKQDSPDPPKEEKTKTAIIIILTILVIFLFFALIAALIYGFLMSFS